MLNKEFKITILKKLEEPQENMDKQFNKIRRIIQERMRSSINKK